MLAERFYSQRSERIMQIMMDSLPRELRDLIWGYLFEDSRDRSRHIKVHPRECFMGRQLHNNTRSSVFEWKAPFWLKDKVIDKRFAEEMIQHLSENIEFSIDANDVRGFIDDDFGVFRAAGYPTAKQHSQRNTIRSLTVNLNNNCTNIECSVNQAHKSLRALLGPWGIKNKSGFRLRLLLSKDSEYFLDEWGVAMADIVSEMRKEGFIVEAYYITIKYRRTGARLMLVYNREDITQRFESTEDDSNNK
jgi:hypothetical protein